MDFDALVDRYEKPIYNLIFRLIGDRDEAADLTQETFVAAYKAMSGFRAESSEFTWLYRIACNKCKNRFKKLGHQKRHESRYEDLEQLEYAGDTSIAAEMKNSPEKELQRKELKERVMAAIGNLPPDYRVVVVLRELHGMSYQEIAQVAELSVDVVKMRLSRGREMLRKKLGPYLIQDR